jgi:hypothetical protein
MSIVDQNKHISTFEPNSSIIRKTIRDVDGQHKIRLTMMPEKPKKKATTSTIKTGNVKGLKDEMVSVLRYATDISSPSKSIINCRNKVTIYKKGQVSGQSLGNGHARVLVEVSLNPKCTFDLLDPTVMVSLSAFPNLKILQTQSAKTSVKPVASKTRPAKPISERVPAPTSRVKVRPHGDYNEQSQVVIWKLDHPLKAKDPPTQLHIIIDLGSGSTESSADSNAYPVPVIIKGRFEDNPLTSTLVQIDNEDEYMHVNIKHTNKIEYRFL